MRPAFLPTCPRNHTCTGPGKRPFDPVTLRHLKGWTEAPGIALPNDPFKAEQELATFVANGLNVGIRTNEYVAVLDADSRKQSILDAMPVGWQDGVVHETPRGFHVFFRVPEGLTVESTRFKLPKNKLTSVRHHLEIYGSGRFVVTPPSPGYLGDLQPIFDPAQLPEWPFSRLFALGTRGVAIWNKTLPLDDNTQSGYDMALANTAALLEDFRENPQWIEDLLKAFRRVWGADEAPESYLERTVNEALRWATEKTRGESKRPIRQALDPQEVATRFIEWVGEENLLYSQAREQILVWPHDNIRTVQKVLKHYPLWSPLSEDQIRWLVRAEFGDDYPALSRVSPTREVVDSLKGLIWQINPLGDELLERGLRQTDYIFTKNPQGEWMAVPVVEHADLVRDAVVGPQSLEIAKMNYTQIGIEGPVVLQRPEYNEWQRLVQEWVDESTENWLASWIGYLMVPDTSWQKILVMLGPGANGKSLFLSAVRRLLGEPVVSAVPLDELGRGFSVHHMERSLANLVDDLDLRYIERTGAIKTLVAGEPLRAEIKFGPVYWFRPVTRLVSATNQMPQVSDNTHGWLRRLDIVPFDRSFRADPAAHRKLLYRIDKALQQGHIGHWALSAFLEILNKGHREAPRTVEEAFTAYSMEADSVRAFVADALNLDKGNTSYGISAKGMYAVYVQWAREQGLHPVSKMNFNKRMEALGFKRVTGKRALDREGLRTQVWLGTSPQEDFVSTFQVIVGALL